MKMMFSSLKFFAIFNLQKEPKFLRLGFDRTKILIK
jgi:hypothetical protein